MGSLLYYLTCLCVFHLKKEVSLNGDEPSYLLANCSLMTMFINIYLIY